ncbi:MAG: hypothetical protein RLZZ387_3839 [Chloroflexota bacterium]|jgi:uncharacterized protein YkwD
MHVALLRLLLVALLAVLLENISLAQAQVVAAEHPVMYLPLVTRELSDSALSIAPYEQKVIDLTNKLRTEVGCPALTVSPELAQVARAHSRDMAANNFFDHIGSDGSSSFQRVQRAGYSYSMVAENIAAGFSTPESVMLAWSQSPGHRSNLLNCALREIGVGYAFEAGSEMGHYWTQEFGTP